MILPIVGSIVFRSWNFQQGRFARIPKFFEKYFEEQLERELRSKPGKSPWREPGNQFGEGNRETQALASRLHLIRNVQ
jgi:hypothetical protein